MPVFVVSGGSFERDDGCLMFINLDDTRGEMTLLSEVWIGHPTPAIAVRGKGITGVGLDGPDAWVCFSNMIAKVRLSSGEVTEVIESDAFNDLHQLVLKKGRLIVANTGNESVDYVNLQDRGITRVDLLGAEMRRLRPRRSQVEDTEPHIHHVASADLNEQGNLIIGLGRQARVLNASTWTWRGPRMRSPIHDVHCGVFDEVWCTSVDGQVYRIDGSDDVQSWSLGQFQPSVGWTRGLAVTERGIVVGTTAIRKSNRDYFKMITGGGGADCPACIQYIPFVGGASAGLQLPDGGNRKVFSIREMRSH